MLITIIVVCLFFVFRKLWEFFIKCCHEHTSLHGISFEEIRAQLSGVEMKKTYILNPLAKEFIPRAFRNQIMGTPVIQGHLHQASPGVRSSPITAQGISRSVLSPTPTITSQTAAGHPLGSAPLRFTGHSGMVRSASPMHVIDPFTGQRVLYVPVMPVRMVPGHGAMYPHHHPGLPYMDHHGMPHPYPHHGMPPHPYGLGPPVRHSPPQGPPPMGSLSPSQLSPQHDKGAQSKEHTPVKQRGSPLVRSEQKANEGSSPKAGSPLVPMHSHMHGKNPGARKLHSPNIGHGPALGPGPGPAHGPGPGEPQELARVEEMRIQEEFNYLLRTRGQEHANNFMMSVRRSQNARMNSPQPGSESVNHVEQLLQKLKMQQNQAKYPNQQQQQSSSGPAQGQHGGRQQGLLMQQRGMPNQHQNDHHHRGGQGDQMPQDQDLWHQKGHPTENHNKTLHVEVNHYPNNTLRSNSNFLQQPGREYDVPSPRGSSEPPTPPFVRDLAAHDFGANDPSPRTPRTPSHPNNLPPEAFQFPDQYRDYSRPMQPTAMDQQMRIALQIPRSGSSSSSEHSPRHVNDNPNLFSNNLPTVNEVTFPSLRSANPSQEEWAMVNNSVDRVAAGGSVTGGDFRQFSSPVPHNYSPALQAQQNSTENSTHHHQNSYHPNSPAMYEPGLDNQVVPPGPPGAGKEEPKQPAAMSYANVLRAPPKPKLVKPQEDRIKTASPDPFSLIKDLGNRQNKDGFYSYFN